MNLWFLSWNTKLNTVIASNIPQINTPSQSGFSEAKNRIQWVSCWETLNQKHYKTQTIYPVLLEALKLTSNQVFASIDNLSSTNQTQKPIILAHKNPKTEKDWLKHYKHQLILQLF